MARTSGLFKKGRQPVALEELGTNKSRYYRRVVFDETKLIPQGKEVTTARDKKAPLLPVQIDSLPPVMLADEPVICLASSSTSKAGGPISSTSFNHAPPSTSSSVILEDRHPSLSVLHPSQSLHNPHSQSQLHHSQSQQMQDSLLRFNPFY